MVYTSFNTFAHAVCRIALLDSFFLTVGASLVSFYMGPASPLPTCGTCHQSFIVKYFHIFVVQSMFVVFLHLEQNKQCNPLVCSKLTHLNDLILQPPFKIKMYKSERITVICHFFPFTCMVFQSPISLQHLTILFQSPSRPLLRVMLRSTVGLDHELVRTVT